MARLTASIWFFILATLAGGRAQAPAVPGEQQYPLIDAQSTRSRLTRTVNLSKVRERLVDAVEKSYGVHFVAGFSSSANLLLKRGDAGPGSYRMVVTSSESAFLKELNQAASQGFRVVPGGIKAFEEGGADRTCMCFGNNRIRHETVLRGQRHEGGRGRSRQSRPRRDAPWLAFLADRVWSQPILCCFLRRATNRGATGVRTAGIPDRDGRSNVRDAERPRRSSGGRVPGHWSGFWRHDSRHGAGTWFPGNTDRVSPHWDDSC